MKGSFVLLTFTSFLAAASLYAQTATDPVVENFVAMARPRVGASPGPGEPRLLGVRGEGRTMIWQVEMFDDLDGALGPPEIAGIIAGAFCLDPEAATFFGEGRALRVEVSHAGRSTGAASVDHCPGPSGQGLNAVSLAAMMQTMVGHPIEGNVRVAAFRADGEILVATLDGPAGWRANGAGEAVTGRFVRDFCQEGPREYFNGANRFRVDTLEGGNNAVPGRVQTACPGR